MSDLPDWSDKARCANDLRWLGQRLAGIIKIAGTDSIARADDRVQAAMADLLWLAERLRGVVALADDLQAQSSIDRIEDEARARQDTWHKTLKDAREELAAIEAKRVAAQRAYDEIRSAIEHMQEIMK